MNIQEKLEKIIKYDAESVTLDYKKEEYSLGKNGKKHEFLKDICSFLNHPSNEEKFVIIGVNEFEGVPQEFFEISELTDEANYQQVVSENLEPKVNFEYKKFQYEGKNLAYFRLFDNNQRPYLFKKEIIFEQRPIIKAGDGFIRQGTSSRKLVRSDFEIIYKERYTQSDRSKDLKINGHISFPDPESSFALFGVQSLDFDVLNLSNTSIEFDAELIIENNEGYLILTEDELNEALDNAANRSFYQRTPKINFFVSVEKNNEFLKIERITRNSKHAVMIAQKGIEKNLFCNHLYVLSEKKEIEVNGQLIIRCDEFILGPLIQDVIFKIKV
jgi:hypothetical protein